jgi:membrane protein implicated in regulation of membrane protease activity
MSLLAAQQLVMKREAELKQFEFERSRLRVLLWVAAASPWLPMMVWGWKIGLFCAVSVAMIYVVGRYINFFHVREARQLLHNAKEQLSDMS